MANWLKRLLKEKITHWTVSGFDEFGSPTGFTRNIIEGKYEDRSELFINQNKEEERSEATVFLEDPVSVGDYLYQGESIANDPTTLDQAREVREVKKINSLKGDIVYRRAML